MTIRNKRMALSAEQDGLRCVSPLHRQTLAVIVDEAPDKLLVEWREQVRLVEKRRPPDLPEFPTRAWH